MLFQSIPFRTTRAYFGERSSSRTEKPFDEDSKMLLPFMRLLLLVVVVAEGNSSLDKGRLKGKEVNF